MKNHPAEIQATAAEIEKVLQMLEETPRRIASASNGLTEARLHDKADEKSWSANDILAHLRACVDVWGKSIQLMLAQDNPTMRHISPRTWIRKTNYPKLAFDESLQTFTTQHSDLLRTLRALAFEDWSRSAMIEGRKHSVFSQARRMALHEHEHCEQLEAILK
jgi:hypothetical protein